MDKIDKLYYINLNRREDRKAHFLNECKKVNIPEDKIITSEKLAVIRDEIINTCNEFTKNRIENNEL